MSRALLLPSAAAAMVVIAAAMLGLRLAPLTRNASLEDTTTSGAMVARDPASGLTAIATPGARNVRIVDLRGGRIRRAGETFVPAGETVSGLRWAGDGVGLVVETTAQRYALDTRTWHIAALPAMPPEWAALAAAMHR